MCVPRFFRAHRPSVDGHRYADEGRAGTPRAGAVTVLVALALLLWLAGGAAAQVGTCQTNGCILDMSPTIYVLNNEWGNNGVGSGSITVSSQTSWSTSWDYAPSSDWTVISYPSAILGWQWGYRLANTGFPVQLASRTPVGTTVAFRVVPDPTCAPGGVGGGGTGSRVCRLDVSYDLWLHDTSNAGTSTPVYEVMIWVAYSRELFSGTTPNAYATLGGHNWKVLLTQGGSSPVATFLLNEAADLTGATLNITDFTDWLVANQWVSATWWLDSVQFGTELFKGKGVLNVTNYTATVGSATPPPPLPAIGFTVGTTTASPNPVGRRRWLTVGTNVTAVAAASGIVVDLEIYNAAGTKVAQQVYSGQSFTAGQSRSYNWRWRVPSSLAPGTYTIKVGVLDSSWSTLYTWVDSAATVTVQ